MARAELPQALTANRLKDGEVVYRTAEGRWSPRFADAAIYATRTESEAALAAAAEDEKARRVVAVYLFEVDLTEAGPAPRGTREIIRAKGPTVRLDLGKQAGNSAEHGPHAHQR